jgi:uncharacterized protein RhaS with RHS repeats
LRFVRRGNQGFLEVPDSRTGRYTQGDPIGLDGGWNRFGYVDGNPLGAIGPEGLRAAQSGMRPWENTPVGGGTGAVVPGGGGAAGGRGGGSAGGSGRVTVPPIIPPNDKADPPDRPWRQRDTWHVYVICPR